MIKVWDGTGATVPVTESTVSDAYSTVSVIGRNTTRTIEDKQFQMFSFLVYIVFPRSLDPFYIVTLYKIGQDFLGI